MNKVKRKKPARIWVTGATGMLGTSITQALTEQNIPFYSSTRSEADISSSDSIRRFLGKRKPLWIINCAAYTDVEGAEFNHDAAFSANAEGVGNLAALASERGSTLIHFSTDYVFNGEKKFPYSENDMTDPVSVYGMSKLIGEEKIQGTENLKYMIFRISWLYKYGFKCFPSTIINLLKTKKEIKVVRDQKGSPSYAPSLAEHIVELILSKKSESGIFHYSDGGELTWFDFASEINKMAVIHRVTEKLRKIIPVTSNEFPSQVKRPANSLLKKYKIEESLDIKPVEWQDNLIRFFQELNKNEKIK